MSPRQLSVTVCPWPEYRDGRRYRARVERVVKSAKPSGLAVELEHLDSDQQGRRLEVILPLPPRPGGLTAGLFRACGMDVIVGARIVVQEIIGRIVAVNILRQPEGRWSVVSFEPIKETQT